MGHRGCAGHPPRGTRADRSAGRRSASPHSRTALRRGGELRVSRLDQRRGRHVPGQRLLPAPGPHEVPERRPAARPLGEREVVDLRQPSGTLQHRLAEVAPGLPQRRQAATDHVVGRRRPGRQRAGFPEQSAGSGDQARRRAERRFGQRDPAVQRRSRIGFREAVGPVDLDGLDRGGLPQTELKGQAVLGSAAGATADLFHRRPAIGGHLDPSSDRAAIRAGPLEDQGQPVVLDRRLVAPEASDGSTAGGHREVEIAVAVMVRKGDAATVEGAVAEQAGHVTERPVAPVVEQHVGRGRRRESVGDEEILPAVVVDIAGVGADAPAQRVEGTRRRPAVDEQVAVEVLVERVRRRGPAGPVEIRIQVVVMVEGQHAHAEPGGEDPGRQRHVGEDAAVVPVQPVELGTVVAGEQIDPAVAVDVGRHHACALSRGGDPQLDGDLVELQIAEVAIEQIRPDRVDIDVEQPVPVVVEKRHAPARGLIVDPGQRGDIGEAVLAVGADRTVVAVQHVGARFEGDDVDVEVAVVVQVAEGGADTEAGVAGAGGDRHVGEQAVTVVAQHHVRAMVRQVEVVVAVAVVVAPGQRLGQHVRLCTRELESVDVAHRFDVEPLIDRDVLQGRPAAVGPLDDQAVDLGGVTESEERLGRLLPVVTRPGADQSRHRQLTDRRPDHGADRTMVGAEHARPDREPAPLGVNTVPDAVEQAQRRRLGARAIGGLDQIQIAVSIEVDGDQRAAPQVVVESRGVGHVIERTSGGTGVAEEHRAVRRMESAEPAVGRRDVQPAVVVGVEERRTPAPAPVIDLEIPGDLDEPQLAGGRVVAQQRVVPRPGGDVGHVEIEVAVVVVVADGQPHVVPGDVQTGLEGDIDEGPVPLIDPHLVFGEVDRLIDVLPTVAVDVDEHRLPVPQRLPADPRLVADLLEAAVLPVAEQPGLAAPEGDEQVEPAVVVDIPRGDAASMLRRGDDQVVVDSGGGAHLLEHPVHRLPVESQRRRQRTAWRGVEAIPGDEQVQTMVAVVVEPDRGTARGERADADGDADLLEVAVSQVAVELIGHPGGGGDEKIDIAVVVEVGGGDSRAVAEALGIGLDTPGRRDLDEAQVGQGRPARKRRGQQGQGKTAKLGHTPFYADSERFPRGRPGRNPPSRGYFRPRPLYSRNRRRHGPGFSGDRVRREARRGAEDDRVPDRIGEQGGRFDGAAGDGVDAALAGDRCRQGQPDRRGAGPGRQAAGRGLGQSACPRRSDGHRQRRDEPQGQVHPLGADPRNLRGAHARRGSRAVPDRGRLRGKREAFPRREADRRRRRATERGDRRVQRGSRRLR